MMTVLWSLVWIGALGAVAWAAVQWIRSGSHNSSGRAPAKASQTAREVLDERLAAGEIDVVEYQQRRAAIEDGSRVEAPV